MQKVLFEKAAWGLGFIFAQHGVGSLHCSCWVAVGAMLLMFMSSGHAWSNHDPPLVSRARSQSAPTMRVLSLVRGAVHA